MLTSVEFVKPTPELVEHVAANMRQADQDEIWASSNALPLPGLIESLRLSHFSSVAVINGEPIAVFGLVITQILGGVGVPWLLGTNAIDKHFRIFVRQAFILVDEMSRKCSTLVNYVHAENLKSVKLLKAVGFTVDEPAPFGVEGELFHKFYMEKENV